MTMDFKQYGGKYSRMQFTKIEVYHQPNNGQEWYFDCANCSFLTTSRIYLFNPTELRQFLAQNREAHLTYKNYGKVTV